MKRYNGLISLTFREKEIINNCSELYFSLSKYERMLVILTLSKILNYSSDNIFEMFKDLKENTNVNNYDLVNIKTNWIHNIHDCIDNMQFKENDTICNITAQLKNYDVNITLQVEDKNIVKMDDAEFIDNLHEDFYDFIADKKRLFNRYD